MLVLGLRRDSSPLATKSTQEHSFSKAEVLRFDEKDCFLGFLDLFSLNVGFIG